MNHTRARSLASPGRAGPGRAVAVAVAEARRGAARPAGRAVRCGVMAILPLTAINRAIKRAIKSVINGHNRITSDGVQVQRS